MQKPKISIVMPVYNSEAYMEKSINSILNQTLKEIELICINDTSKDNSLKVLQKISKKDKRLKILDNQKNLGPGGSRNRAILKARGEFILFVDSDDWLELDACEKLYTRVTSEKSDVVYIRPKIVFENKIILDKRLFKKGEIKDKEKVFKKNLRREIAWAPWTKMIKRDLFIKNKILFPNIHVAEDIVFSAKVLHFAKKISECNDYLYNYLIRPGSLMSDSNPQRRVNNYFESIEIVKEFMMGEGILDKYKRDFVYFKFYNYLAISKVLPQISDRDALEEYNRIIRKDSDIDWKNLIRCIELNSVFFGTVFMKLGLFGPLFRIYRSLSRLFGKWVR